MKGEKPYRKPKHYDEQVNLKISRALLLEIRADAEKEEMTLSDWYRDAFKLKLEKNDTIAQELNNVIQLENAHKSHVSDSKSDQVSEVPPNPERAERAKPGGNELTCSGCGKPVIKAGAFHSGDQYFHQECYMNLVGSDESWNALGAEFE